MTKLKRLDNNNQIVNTENNNLKCLTELMTKLDRTDEEMDKVVDKVMCRYNLNNNYEWEVDNKNTDIFSLCDGTNAINLNILIPSYIDHIIKDCNCDKNHIYFLHDYLENYLKNCVSQVEFELEYYFTQTIHNAVYNISKIIDEKYPDLLFGSSFNDYFSKYFSYYTILNYNNCIQSPLSVYYYTDETPSFMNNSFIDYSLYTAYKIQFVDSATVNLHNFIYSFLVKKYSCILSSKIVTDIMLDIDDVFLGFHDSLISIYELMDNRIKSVYSNIPDILKYFKSYNDNKSKEYFS